ncbi:transposase domain-containing protein [Undibacterium flavidum]|uniref:DDE-type integrase/transposase/recombinase n=1 Tax=Undibacterium flavidum TaxID=2762297 RepID=A0ABR6Y717_9BURK|nr:transposase domain-containing protein [Undibacterium flavidum]MBC3872413.1 DDE-type integrase/transposase/recombinase [Undibacterium flavidum]
MNGNQIEFVTAEEVAELTGLTLRQVNERCLNPNHKQRLCGAEQVTINSVKTWKVPVNSISNEAHYKLCQQQKDAFEGRQSNPEKLEKAADLCEKRSAVLASDNYLTADPMETAVNTNDAFVLTEISCLPKVGKRSAVSETYLTVIQVSELEDKSLRTIRDRCNNNFYKNAKKEKINGGEGWLIPITDLSKNAQKAYAKQFVVQTLADSSVKDLVVVKPVLQDDEYSQLWEKFDRKGSNFKKMAHEALEVLLAYVTLIEAGASAKHAESAIKASHNVSRATIYRSLNLTRNHPRAHWLPLLCPHYHGGRGRDECTPEAYAFMLALKSQSPHTKLSVILREAAKVGIAKGWKLPSRDILSRRFKEVPSFLFKEDAELKRSFPAVERDYANLDLHQCWESDGCRADVWCHWEDGTVSRPFVIAIRDVRTRRILALRICKNPNAEAVLGVFGMAMTNTQAIPRYFKLDNGREYANKMFTGQQKTRYRFKSLLEEAKGILTVLGVKVLWSEPGHGQDKPIESWWNVIHENCDKSPMFVGAYCGKDVLSKPEQFHQEKAVPVRAYGAKLIETVIEFERRPHRGSGMNMRTPLNVFEELASTTITNKPTPAQIRRCKMGVLSLSLDKKDASISFKMDGFPKMRYWHETLVDLPISERTWKYNVYFEWDDPNSPVSVYRGDVFICDASPMQKLDFIEAPESGKVIEHVAAKKKYVKHRKEVIKAVRQGGKLALPDMNSPMHLAPLVLPNQESIIVEAKRLREVAAPVSPIKPIEGRYGEFINTETQEIYKGRAAQEEEMQAQFRAEGGTIDTEQYLEELRKKREEELRNSAY